MQKAGLESYVIGWTTLEEKTKKWLNEKLSRMKNDCLICNNIALIKENKNPYLVKELETGYIVIGEHQYYPGYTLLLGKYHVQELHELPKQIKTQFLDDMSKTAEAVFKAFSPKKLNYELLGNSVPHLHWHIFPRYATDDNSKQPIWVIDKAIRTANSTKPTQEKLAELKKKLLKYL